MRARVNVGLPGFIQPPYKARQDIFCRRQCAELLQESERFHKHPILYALARSKTVNGHHFDVYSLSSWWNTQPMARLRSIHR